MLQNILNKKEEQPSTLQVTDRILSYGGQTWAVRNITTVGKYKITKKNPFKGKHFARAVVVFFLGYFFLDVYQTFGRIAILGSLSFIIYAIWKNIQNKPKYGLKIVSSAGESELLTSEDEDFIDELVDAITEVIQSDTKSSLTINVDNRSIYDNIKNSVIGSHLHSGGNLDIGDRN